MRVPLPMPLALYVCDFMSPASRSEFDRLLGAAEATFEMPLQAGASEQDIQAPGAARNRQYDAVGEYIARHSQILLALWDGQPAQKQGGTAEIVKRRLTDLPRAAATQLRTPDPVHSGARQVGQPALDNLNDAHQAVSRRSFG